MRFDPLVAVLVGAFSVLVSSGAWAQILPVPIGDRVEESATSVACSGALVISDGDLIFDASCGCDGAPSTVFLMSGKGLVHAGSRQVIVELGGARVSLESSRMVVVQVGEKWVIRIEGLGGAASARLLLPEAPRPEAGSPEDPPAKEAPAKETPAREIPREISLEIGKVLVLSSPREVAAGSGRFAKEIAFVSGRLASRDVKAANGPLLEYRPVEEKRDFAAAGVGEQSEAGELEIEAIEVEVGCVEICVD